jgi:hypothetical protein
MSSYSYNPRTNKQDVHAPSSYQERTIHPQHPTRRTHKEGYPTQELPYNYSEEHQHAAHGLRSKKSWRREEIYSTTGTMALSTLKF